MAGRRRRARILALQALFELDAVGHVAEDVVGRIVAEGAASAEAAGFGRQLVEGVLSNKQKIDETISSLAPAWPLEQMAVVDRNILRLAVYEFLHETETPSIVVIDEAIELARRFGGDDSWQFTNGILDAVRKKLEAAGTLNR